jgi:hypothetical protein
MTALCQQVLGRAPARPVRREKRLVRGEKWAGRSNTKRITSHISPLTSNMTSRRSSESPVHEMFQHFRRTQLSEITRHRFLDPFSSRGR